MSDFKVRLKYKNSIPIQKILLSKYEWNNGGVELCYSFKFERFVDDTIIYFYIRNNHMTYGTYDDYDLPTYSEKKLLRIEKIKRLIDEKETK